ncbi:MAG TPA: hypothetical protein VII73_07730 [Caulobacteraceae bacterium]
MRLLIAGLAGLSLAAAAVPASAQTAASPPIPSAPGKASVETTTIDELINTPSDKAVLAKDYPELLAYPGIDQIKGMSLRAISAFPEAKLDDARLAAIQKDLDAAPPK